MIDLQPVAEGALIYASLYMLMSVGLTLTYMVTKVPNFAHGSLVTVGAYLAFTLYHFDKVSPYVAAPLCFVLGGIADLMIYRFAIRPVGKKVSSPAALMIATLAADIALIGIFGIYSDYLVTAYKIFDSRFFILSFADISVFGLKGVSVIGPLLIVMVTIVLHLILTKTRFGIAMRAVVGNLSLASVVGIDIERVYTVAWIVSGGLAGTAGALALFWVPGNPTVGDVFLPGIFASSLLGGLLNVYGGLLGGFVVGLSQVLLTSTLSIFLGSWIISYGVGVPLVIMIATLLIFPRGVTGINWRNLLRQT